MEGVSTESLSVCRHAKDGAFGGWIHSNQKDEGISNTRKGKGYEDPCNKILSRKGGKPERSSRFVGKSRELSLSQDGEEAGREMGES